MTKRYLSLLFGCAACLSLVAVGATASSAKPFLGELVSTGQTTVDGLLVVGQDSIVSGSRVTTGPDGSAVAGLGKYGRIFIAPGSDVTVVFENNELQVDVRAGSVRLQKGTATTASILTGAEGSSRVFAGTVSDDSQRVSGDRVVKQTKLVAGGDVEVAATGLNSLPFTPTVGVINPNQTISNQLP